MMREVDHLVLGALLHDIGKVMERGERHDQYRNNTEQKSLDCPHGSYHALHTRSFCEWLAERIPLLNAPAYNAKEITSDHWIHLASRHHANNLTKLQGMVQKADGLASGEREQGTYQGGIEKKVRLESILERIDLTGINRETEYRLPLMGLSLEEEDLFALPAEQFPMNMDVRRSKRFNRNVHISPEKLAKENRELADGLVKALEKLPSWSSAHPDAAYALVRTLLAQLERFLSYVPSATNIVHPDISLFDHLRITAAIAETSYWENKSGEQNAEPWRLVCGDFSGIQNFLYRITAKGAAKGVRGRSFFVELLCDSVAEHLLRVAGLHLPCRIYSSGGRFYLLIAACQEARLREAVAEVNQLLLEQFRGDLFLGLGMASLKKEHFRQGRMGERWKSVNLALLQDRNRRFQSVIERTPAFFNPLPLTDGQPVPTCQVCGRGDAEAGLQPANENEERTLCRSCQQMERLGQGLAATTPATHLLWVWQKRVADLPQLKKYRGIDLPIPGGCSIYLIDDKAPLPEPANQRGLHLEGLNQVHDAPPQSGIISHGFRFVGRWRTGASSTAWEFDDFAENAEGIQRFGVLRMDVDNLGHLLVAGLDFPGISGQEPEMGSLSRWATLSRQLYRFFSGHLLTLMETQNLDRTQIIYAGGDDILLIGSWDQLPEAARIIHEKFGLFCSNNPVFTLSGGIALGTGKYPFSRLALQAGDSLEQAKKLGTGNKSAPKNAISFLETPVGWEDMSAVETLRDALLQTVDQSGGNRSIIARMTETVIAQQEQRNRLQEYLKKGQINHDKINEMLRFHRWQWQLVYSLKRFSNDHTTSADLITTIQKTLLQEDPTLRHSVLDWLALPVRWADFLSRKER